MFQRVRVGINVFVAVGLIAGAGCVNLDLPPQLRCSGPSCKPDAQVVAPDDPASRRVDMAARPASADAFVLGAPDGGVGRDAPQPSFVLDARADVLRTPGDTADAAASPGVMFRDMMASVAKDVSPFGDTAIPTADAKVDAPVDAPAPTPDLAPDMLPGSLDGLPQPMGAACSQASQCQGGLCVDGVCCASTCSPCSACNLPGKQGACALRASGAFCGESQCLSAVFTPSPTCDGVGNCRPGVPTTCGGYACFDTLSCRNSCTTKSDCAGPGDCVGGMCQTPIAQGQDCSQDTQCGTGKCRNGVCCATDCSGLCYSCNVVGSKGTCAPVPRGGADVLGRCPNQGSTSCGMNGSCDGAGGCDAYPLGSFCGAASCSNAMAVAAPTCAAANSCVMATPVSCVNFPCNGSICRATCANDGECVAPSKCFDTQCGGLFAAYYNSDNLEEPAGFTRVDAMVDFDWGTGGPQGSLGDDRFSIRWTGKIIPRYTETYTIYLDVDDGVRLWLGDLGTPLFDEWRPQDQPRFTKTIGLQANQAIDIKLEYFEATGKSKIRLHWSSPRQAMEIIPTNRLRPP